LKSSRRKSSQLIIIICALLALALIAYLLLKQINKVVNNTTKINDYNLISQSLLGFKGKKNILILFMNNAEMRYGGGFIGTVGYVSVDNGKISSDPVRSVYYYDHKYEDIKYSDKSATARDEDKFLNLRNSGRNLDWPTNAKRAKDIYELESGKKVDVVIAVTPEVLKSLLISLGNVDLPDYNKRISPDNIAEELQMEIEKGQDKTEGRDPKTILTGLGNTIIERLSTKNVSELIDLSKGFGELINKRQILFYTGSYDLAQSFKRSGISGSTKSFAGDYFMMAEDNISIDKSSAFIDRVLKRNLVINQDGSVNISVDIARTQNRQKDLPYIDPRGGFTYLIKENKSYVKFALPKGSKINYDQSKISIEKLNSESGYDIYRFISELNPLVQSDYSFSYSPPYKIAMFTDKVEINGFLQLQNGGWPYKLINSVQMPSGWRLANSSVNPVVQKDGKVIYDNIVDKDQFLSFTYAKQ
jgi:hypothetical protein